ncbi:MAG: C4-dicarboxylate ABC transporter, partial [Angelakisella sp.]
IIMVGSIVLPILISVGVPAMSAACIFLMAFTTGLTFNIANWKSFSSIFNLDIEVIKGFEIYLLIATFIATLVLIFVEFKKNGIKFAFAAPVSTQETRQLSGFTGGMAMITPLIPIVLVAVFKVPVCPAFMAGIIWILLFTAKGFSKAMNVLVKTCYDGITDSGPAIILMVGIGILYLAVTHPMVKAVLNPFLLAVVPSGRIGYILFFTLLAPLSLYRGPMNLFGLGSGIAALVIGLGTLSPLAVMGAFLAAERIQGCGDPTNTQNVWTANFAEVDVNTITKKLLPYLWTLAAFGVVLSGFMYF